MRLEHLLSGVVNDVVVNIYKDDDVVKDNPKNKKRTDDNRQSGQRTIEHTAHPRLLVFYKSSR